MSDFKITGPGEYRMRNGDKVVLTRKLSNDIQWLDSDDDIFNDDGSYYSSEKPSEFDIIAPWTDSPESQPAEQMSVRLQVAAMIASGIASNLNFMDWTHEGAPNDAARTALEITDALIEKERETR